MKRISVLFSVFVILLSIKISVASVGDRTTFYINCVERCTESNCTKDGFNFASAIVQPIYLQALYWSCSDECKYDCMWRTVDGFLRRKWDVPQFYGKWPFIRLFGLQEPASVLFSLLNFGAHFVMLQKFKKEVRVTSPLYWFWQIYAIVCLNGWFWSAVFHARDVPFTEKMDYFCAFSMVLFSCYGMLIRFLSGRVNLLSILLTIFTIGLFIHHVTYLSMVNFDYGYNMTINIIVGIVNGLGWIMWSMRNRHNQPYVWRCVSFVVLAGLTSLLEMADFPPLLWTIDAHSLWHLSTAGLPFLFYRFLIDDCKYLRKQQASILDNEVIKSKET